MKQLTIVMTLCLFVLSCSRGKEEKNTQLLTQKEDQLATEKAAAEKAAAEKAAADRLSAINKIIKFLNTVDTTVRENSDLYIKLYTTKLFTYSESDKSLCFEGLATTLYKDGNLNMLNYSGYKIFLEEANPEIKMIQDESNLGITKLRIESLASENGDLIALNKGDVFEDSRYKKFKEQSLTELKKSDAKKSIKTMTLPAEIAPRFKKALSDLLQLHGVEPLAY
jgi:hypothetical protein